MAELVPMRIAVPWRDHQTMEEARAGDEAAFERVVAAHERQVLRTALRMLGNREDAKDAAQEVFLRLYRRMGQFSGERELRPWLYRMTVNLCLDALRRRRSGAAVEAVVEEPVEPGRDPEEALAAAQERALIRAALRTLAPKEQAAIVLRDLEGCSTAEVAEILESSEATVRSQISTGRVKIRKFVLAQRKERR